MNTNMSLRNDRFRGEMNLNPLLQKVIAVYHITEVIAIIICVAVSINSQLFYFLLSAIIPIILFIIFWVASKCNFQDLVVILVHYNPILSTMWFLSVFPAFVCACTMSANFVTSVAAMTGILSLGSAIFAVMGIWKSARKVVLIARAGECGPVSAVGSVPPSYDAPVTFTDLNSIRITQTSYGQPMLPR